MSKSNPIIKELKNFKELQHEYDFKEDGLTYRMVLQSMLETLEGYLKTIHQVIQPEEFYAMHESVSFDDADKQQLFELYKQMMILHRDILKSAVENDNKKMLALIMAAHKQLISYKKPMLNALTKMQDAWKKDHKKSVIGYMG